MVSANALAGAAHQTWTQAVRYNRLDFAEVCCTADSQLAGEVISRGGSADRYSHWNGFDLTTRKGAEALKAGLDNTRPRWVWFSPPCGPDSPMQNLNQWTEEQRETLAWKKSRTHRIQRNVLEGHLAPQIRLVRRSGLGTIFVMPQLWNQRDFLGPEASIPRSPSTWLSMGIKVSRIPLVKELVLGDEVEGHLRRFGSESLSKGPLPQTIGER